MLIIKRIEISSFRSILNLKIDVDISVHKVVICGENNVGKTNTLKALNLFFFPEEYEITKDRPTIKFAQGGARIDPKITVDFFDTNEQVTYKITRDLKKYDGNNLGLYGNIVEPKIKKKVLSLEEIESILNKISFKYVEAINVNIPFLIDQLTSDAMDVEYDKTRLSKSKKELKEAYDKYTSGLQEILNSFSRDISGTFRNFRDNWGITFKVPVSSDTFRDLISNDIELHINDKGCLNVDQKGSGLQRLAVILLNFEILKRIKNKTCIICIDEPDIYLHEGLQRKLMNFFKESSTSIQIFYTTHSKVFIDQYSLKNTILLEAEIKQQYSVRKGKNIDVISTKLVDISCDEGYDKICDHLGIEKNHYDILAKNNILVEGNCDKKYLEELCKFFSIDIPKIISLNGVDNAERYLDFYNSYYYNNISAYKPKVKVLFDNDTAGRNIYQKISNKKYDNITVECLLIKNYLGNSNTSLEKNQTNHEIEDYMYPEVICYLSNKLLSKKRLRNIKTKDIITNLSMASFNKNGILYLIEYKKNELNPDDGADISFVSSSKATDNIKNGLSQMFDIIADKNLINIVNESHKKYPFVYKFLKDLCDFV